MEHSSQPIKPKEKCEKSNSESEIDRLARQWVELMLGQLQHQKYMKKQKN